MVLKWKKLGRSVWYGEDSPVFHYTIEEKPFHLGGTRFHLTRGGISSGNRFASGPTLQGMKQTAKEDAAARIGKRP